VPTTSPFSFAARHRRGLCEVVELQSSVNLLFKLSGSLKDYNSYQSARNIAAKAIREAKRTFESKLASDVKKDSKSFWAYVMSKAKTKEKVGPLKDQFGMLIDDDEMICNIFNNFFISVFTNEELGHILVAGKRVTEDTEDFEIRASDIYEHIVKLKENKAPGDDNIAPKILKEVAVDICYPLSIIFRESLDSGIVRIRSVGLASGKCYTFV